MWASEGDAAHKMTSRWRSNHWFATDPPPPLILLLVFQTRVWTGTLGLILNIEQCHQKVRRKKTGVGSRGCLGGCWAGEILRTSLGQERTLCFLVGGFWQDSIEQKTRLRCPRVFQLLLGIRERKKKQIFGRCCKDNAGTALWLEDIWLSSHPTPRSGWMERRWWRERIEKAVCVCESACLCVGWEGTWQMNLMGEWGWQWMDVGSCGQSEDLGCRTHVSVWEAAFCANML